MKSDRTCGLALFVLTLTVYVSTLCPTVYWGDGGELAAAAYTLGIAHPTGYPVWCLIGKLWTLIFPFGSIAWRLGVMSAIFGAMASVMLFGCCRYLGMPRVVALMSAGLFAFSFTFWQQCIQVETYSLTAFYTCTLLCLAARWRARGCSPRDLKLMAFVYGLAMTNHQTNTLFVPGFLIFVLWTQPSLMRLRDRMVRGQWLSTVAVWLAPLSFYLYLPIRASMSPAVDWGHPTTWASFVFHVSGGYYRRIMFTGSTHDNLARLSTYAHDLHVEYAWALVAVAVAGLASMWMRDRPMAVLLSWIVVADVVFTINYAIYNGYIYLIPTNAVVAVLIGYALHRGWELVPPERQRLSTVGAVVCASLVAMQFAAHRHVSLRHSTQCYDYARNILATSPPNAVVIDNNDVAGYPVFMYLQQVEGMRRDVVVVNRGLLAETRAAGNGWVFEDLCRRLPEVRVRFPRGLTLAEARTEEPLKQVLSTAVDEGRAVEIDDLQGTSAIAIDRTHAVAYSDYLRSKYEVARIGLVDRLYPHGQRPSDADLMYMTDRAWAEYRTDGVYDGMAQRDTFLTLLAIDYSQAGLARAHLAYAHGWYDVAAASYRNVLNLFPLQEAADGLRACEQAQASAASKGSAGT